MLSPVIMVGPTNYNKLLTSKNVIYQLLKLLSISKNNKHFLGKTNQSHRLVLSRDYQTLKKTRSISQVIHPTKSVRRDITNESTISSKALLKSESQLKLAQVMSKCQIESFPLFKDKDFDENRLGQQFGQLLNVLKDSQQNQWNNVLYYPSVSTILGSTLSVQSLVALDRWKKLKINELGEQGFREYQKNLLLRGRLFHSNIKNFIPTKDESTLVINETVEKLWKSLSHVIDKFDNVQLCERPVTHPFLCYKGIVDCVAFYCGKLVIIEWKTSEKLKPTLKDIYDNPLQAVAYLGAINYESSHGLCADQVVLVYAYEDGTNAQIHHLSAQQCAKYWNQWLSRLKSYWELTSFKPTAN